MKMDLCHNRRKDGFWTICVECGRREFFVNLWKVHIRRYSNFRRVHFSRFLLTLATFCIIVDATISLPVTRNTSRWDSLAQRRRRMRVYIASSNKTCRENRINSNGMVQFSMRCSTPKAEIWDVPEQKYVASSIAAKCDTLSAQYEKTDWLMTPKKMDKYFPGWDRC